MEDCLRYEIVTKNRMGMAMEILKEIYNLNIDINAVEVFPKKVIVKIQRLHNNQKEILERQIYKLDGVVKIKEVGLLYCEKNERKLLGIIDSVDEGILSINKKLEIEIFNSYCEKIFHCKREEVLGTDIRKLVNENAPMVNLLENGEKYDNVEINITNSRGVSHYLTTGRPIKDDTNNTLGVVASIKDIKQVIELANMVNSNREGSFKDIIGSCAAIERVKQMVSAVAKSNSTIILRGESGTGKDVFAKSIQSLSDRKNKSFVAINCAALPENLIESELFGYEKGAFTGASSSGKEGLFKQANEGTLFLDEVGELSMVLQAKLLRVLQEGVIRKIGGTKEEKVNVRIIAATNRNLEEMIKNGRFREDLYYRLNVIPIFLPPLRERLDDIPGLVTFFIGKLNKKLNKNISGAELEFVEGLMEYNWPGNIRELENVMERSMNLCSSNFLKRENLVIHFDNNFKMKVETSIVGNNLKLKDIVEICEKEAIIKALVENKSLRKAAKALGVSHTTIMNKINKYNIECK